MAPQWVVKCVNAKAEMETEEGASKFGVGTKEGLRGAAAVILGI